MHFRIKKDVGAGEFLDIEDFSGDSEQLSTRIHELIRSFSGRYIAEQIEAPAVVADVTDDEPAPRPRAKKAK